MMDLRWYDFVGFAGVLVVLAAYGALQARRMNGNGVLFSLLNMVGSAGILIPVWYAKELNWSVLFIETAWILISAYGIWNAVAGRFRKT
jgi:hypothetical protein